MRVLIVDDSVVFRSQIKNALEGTPGIEVIGSANNGKIAIQKLQQLSVDLITLDLEMPEMGGLDTIKEIRRLKFPLKIIVFSSHSTRGSEMTLEALRLGADDFVPKPQGEDLNFETAQAKIKMELVPKIMQFKNPLTKEKTINPGVLKNSLFQKLDLNLFRPQIIVIGSSTGGPPALEQILKSMPKSYRLPIVITQHMPPVFTASLAKRLNDISGLTTVEAQDNQEVLPGHVYVAPGDFHLVLKKVNGKIYTVLNKLPHRNSVRPAVDPLFESAAEIYRDRCMGIILTGMGEDGLVGAKKIKEGSGGILIQDKGSCVVFGMPGAIFDADLYDQICNLSEIREMIIKLGH